MNEHVNYFQYLPISETNIHWDLYLTGAGVATIPAYAPYPPTGHPETYNFSWTRGRVLPEYQVLYIAQGKGLFESTASGQNEVAAGTVIFLFPGIWHRYKPIENFGWKEYWISWNGEYLYRLQNKGLISPENPVYHTEITDKIQNTFDRILDRIKKYPAENSFVLAAYTMEIMAHALESRQMPGEQDIPLPANTHIEDPIIIDALKIIWNHSYRNTNVEDLVNQLPVKRRTLERKFSNALGTTIGQEITRCRVERAKLLLINTKLPIENIALAVGFSGADRLGKVFQKLENTSPGRFRKQQKAT